MTNSASHGLNIAVFDAGPCADRYTVDVKPILGEFALTMWADFARDETAWLAMAEMLQAMKFNAGGDMHGGAPLIWPIG